MPVASASAPGEEPKSFALLELFTSEGCSSCPPADRELEQLTEQAERSGRRVFTLSFHVDYWNDLGWSDPYSDARYSARQQDYLRTFKRRGAYTPELVVNGIEEFVGSDHLKARDALMRMLARPAKAVVSARVERRGAALAVHYSASSGPRQALVQLALLQDRAVSAIDSGENAGQRLVHRNVVRDLRQRSDALPAQGEQRFELPAGLDAAHASVLVFVSDPENREVLGAASARVQG